MSQGKPTRSESRVFPVPSYSAVYGGNPTEAQLVNIIRRFNVYEWLAYLSRAQSVVAAERTLSFDAQAALFKGVVGPKTQNELLEFFARSGGENSVRVLFHEWQIALLQEMAVLHAPTSGGLDFTSIDDRESIAQALLIVRDLMTAPFALDSETTSRATALHELVRCDNTPGWKYAARAFRFFRLDEQLPQCQLSKYLGLFSQVTGVDANHYIFGGLALSMIEFTRSFKDHAESWAKYPLYLESSASALEQAGGAFQRLRCATLADLRALIVKIESHRPFYNWNLTPTRKWPMLALPNNEAHMINLTACFQSVFEGVRHALISAIQSDSPVAFSRTDLDSIYGDIFEDYAEVVLKAAFPKRLHKLDPKNPGRRADFILAFPSGVMVVEAKAKRFRAFSHFEWMTMHDRKAELHEQLGLKDAVDQLRQTIHRLRKLEPVAGLPSYDWTVATIVPVIVTEAKLPVLPGVWSELFGDLDRILDELRSGGMHVAPLRLLSIDDVELLPSLNLAQNGLMLFSEWSRHPQYSKSDFVEFLLQSDINPTAEYMYSAFEALQEFLKAELAVGTH